MRCSVTIRFVKWIPGALSIAFFVGMIALAEPQSSERLAAEAKRSTPAGATYSAPAGWSIRSEPSMVVLEPPETDSHLAIVDVRAADAAAAVTAAWSTYRPDFKRPVKLVIPIPPRDGWDERKDFDYETSPNERAVIAALAARPRPTAPTQLARCSSLRA